MATIVNNPPNSNNSSGPIGMIILLAFLLFLGYLGYAYGLPALRNTQVGAPQVNIPDQIDVNVNTTN